MVERWKMVVKSRKMVLIPGKITENMVIERCLMLVKLVCNPYKKYQ